MTIEEVHAERLKGISVSSCGGKIEISVSDLKEVLFGLNDSFGITISSNLFYALLVQRGIFIKGFHPNKTTLRAYGMSTTEINKILPGSFSEKEAGLKYE